MKITRITTERNPDKVKRKVILDTDRLKERVKELPERIGEVNDLFDEKVDLLVSRLCNLIG